MMCFSNGMSEKQAKEVIDLAIPELNKASGNYKITYDGPADQYPNGLYASWFIIIKRVALKYIKNNCPKAWFKPLFE